MVCSPAGTTIAGVEELEKNGFRKAIFAATDACFDKCVNIKYHSSNNKVKYLLFEQMSE